MWNFVIGEMLYVHVTFARTEEVPTIETKQRNELNFALRHYSVYNYITLCAWEGVTMCVHINIAQ